MSRESQHIFLVGPMGAGKTIVGQALARQLGRDFYDTDLIIEEQQGRTVREIFETSGEAQFRADESATLLALCQEKSAVIATGGGIILREDNRHALKDHGVVIYLAADTQTQMRRTSQDEQRPLLASHDPTERATVLARLASERAPLYADVADHKIDTDQLTTDEVVAAAQRVLNDEDRS